MDDITSLELEVDNVDDVFQILKVSGESVEVISEYQFGETGATDLLPHIAEEKTSYVSDYSMTPGVDVWMEVKHRWRGGS